MLSWLKIKNYLLIENLEIQVPGGFITITGETGAGKSVLLGAISMITGKRADTSVLLDKKSKSVIEAGFIINREHKAFFDNNNLDFDEETIIRREISGIGKSRAFINDTPVKLEQLKQLTDKLIDIHSQHQSLLVAKSDFRINVLDSYADTDDELKSFRELYHRYMATHAKLSELTDKYNKAIREKDYLQFQFDQLEEADLNAGELSELESEEALLNHAEEIRNNLMQSVRALRDADQNCLNTLADVRNLIDNIKPHFSPASDYVNRLESLIIEIKDLAGSFEADAADVHYNPARLEQVRERLNKLNDLLLKHQKEDVEELIKLRDDISKKLLDMDTDNSRINELKAESEKLYTALKTKGDALRKKRQAAIPGLEKKLNKMLAYLGMPDAVFVVDMEKRETPVSNGFDKVDFLFSANRDISPQSIGKVASGGEMSRLMLCLKSIIAQKLRMPSIIFDEIDTGVSGEIAGKMGKMMQNLADNAQVISITHLAQVAALGNIQLHVVKNKSGIQIQKLSDEQRLMEIARMSSGEDVSDAAIEHARILLK